MREKAISALFLAALLNGCSGDGDIQCGVGTQRVGDVCIPASKIECGEGTSLVGDQCVPDRLEGQHYLRPLIELQSLHGVGSHTDEVRIRLEDNLLFNCSYTFNIIDAEDAADMEQLNEGGSTHDSPDADRAPGCKHLDWNGNYVFTTHPGNIRDGSSFLAAWDITDPEAPVQAAFLQEPGTTFQNLAVVNGDIFVGLREQGVGVYRLDTATSTPAFARIGLLGGFTNAWGMAASGSTVFATDLAEALVAIDGSNPMMPLELGRLPLPGTSRFLVIDGDVAYVAAGSAGIAIVDISDPTSMSILSMIEMPGTAVRVAYSEGRIFVAAWNDVRVYDVTDPAAPRFISAVRIRRHYEYEEADREMVTMRIFGVAARGTDVFIGAWENPYSYRLEPDRIAPVIRLQESAARVEFGAVAMGETKTIPVEVSNQGTAPLTLVDNWVVGEGFSVEPKQALIPPGEKVELNVSFTPTDPSVQATGYLHINSDDPEYPLRKPFLAANSPGIVVGSPLPPTSGTLIDGTIWSSSEAEGSVLLLFYFATF